MRQVKIVIERFPDGYVGYPLGFSRGAIVGQGDTYTEALRDTENAVAVFIRHYGADLFWQHKEAVSPERHWRSPGW